MFLEFIWKYLHLLNISRMSLEGIWDGSGKSLEKLYDFSEIYLLNVAGMYLECPC